MAILKTLASLIHLARNVYAAPAPPNTTSAEQFVAWQSQPNERGTWDILTTCVLTMTLCIWTALHLNIPMDSNDRSERKTLQERIRRFRLFRQAGWIIIGLLAPELVVYTAWQQRRVVKAITRMAQTAQKCIKGSGVVPIVEWTESHSWYLVMGGFYFDTNTREPYIPGSLDLILTSEAMHLMTSTSPPLLPEVAEDAIKDRSKADKITKCLAALQAIYQLAQCATRWRGGLPVSQLELNTFGHILCALAIYICWFRKLKDVEIRTRIDHTLADPLAAYLSMCIKEKPWPTKCHPDIAQLFPILKAMRDPQPGAANTDEGAASGDEKTLIASDDERISQNFVAQPTRIIMKYGASPTEKADSDTETVQAPASVVKFPKLRDFSCVLDESLRLNPMVHTAQFKDLVLPILKEGFRPAALQNQDRMSLVCIDLALQYLTFWCDHVVTSLAEDPGGPVQIKKGMRQRRDWTMPPYVEQALATESVDNWPRLDRSRTWHFGLILPAAMIAFLTACYGGIHASAWFYHFPSPVEAMLWRISSVVIASSGILVMVDRVTVAISSHLTDRIVCQASDLGEPWQEYHDREALWLPRYVRSLIRPFVTWRRQVLEYVNALAGQFDAREKSINCSLLVKMPVIACLATFVVARMYVIVEAFVSLRSLPVEAYQTPNWSQWVVHL